MILSSIAYSELLGKYFNAQLAVIGEFSSQTAKDARALHLECSLLAAKYGVSAPKLPEWFASSQEEEEE